MSETQEMFNAEQDEELNALFGDNDFFVDEEAEDEEETEGAVAAEVDTDELTDEDIEAAVSAAEAADALRESYEESEAGTEGEIATKKRGRKRVDLSGMSFSDIVRHKVPEIADNIIFERDDVALSVADREKMVNEVVNEIDGLPKKVSEKAVNALQAACGQAKLSVYTQIAVDLLRQKGSLTLTDLRDGYEAPNPKPYGKSTASSQASQMMKLLPYLKIANREGGTLSLNQDSALADMFVVESSDEEQAA